MTQLLRPIADISAGSWTASSGSDLYAMVDESTPSDTDYIRSPDNPTTQTVELKFGPGTGTHSGCTTRSRLEARGVDTDFDLELVQGTTVLDSWTEVLTVAEGAATRAHVSSGISITDAADLRVRHTARAPGELTTASVNPTGVTIDVYQPEDRTDARVWVTAPLRSGSGTYFTKWQRNGVDYDTASTTSFILGTDTMTAVYTTPASGGVSISAGTDLLQAAFDANAEGTTFTLAAGNHITTVPLVPKTGQTIQGVNGAIVKGSGDTGGFIGYGGANINVTLRNLIIEDFTGDGTHESGLDLPLKAVQGWVVENCEFRNLTYGIVGYYTAIIRNCWIHDNGQYGIVGSAALYEGNLIEGNNTLEMDPNVDAGGSKFLHATDMQLRGNIVRNNYGNGLWPDYDNHGTIFENNIIYDNTLAGIDDEVNCDSIYRYNVLYGNNTTNAGLSLGWGAQISVIGCANVDCYGNDITVGSGTHAIAFRWAEPPYDEYTTAQCGTFGMENVTVHDNVIRLGTAGLGNNSLTGYVGAATSIEFYGNTYDLPSPTGAYFVWEGSSPMNFAAWQALGQDV